MTKFHFTRRCFLIVASLLLFSCVANAGLILQDTVNQSVQVQFFSLVGQSFTAEDPFVTFAFYITSMNRFLTPQELTITLYDGSGFSAGILQSQSFNPGAGFDGYYAIDFTGSPLTVGNIYSVSLTTTTAYWGLEGAQSDLYAGGTSFLQGNAGGCCGTPFADTRFRVTPQESPAAPEPATIGMLSLGAVALAGFRMLSRRKR